MTASPMRDIQLDIYRALMIMYVLFIHVVYWLRDLEEPYMSMVLFEMVVVFFVSGASLSVSRSRHGLLDTVKGRLRRIVLPFYTYAVVAIAVCALATALLGDTTPYGFQPLSLRQYGWKDVMSVILCLDVPQVPNNTHLWFIVPYLILSCTFPLQQRLMRHFPNRHLYMAACVLLFLLAQAVTGSELLREVLCYNVFMVAGYLYYKRLGAGCVALVAVVAAALLAGYLLLGGSFVPMQAHKFPPDWLFMLYGVLTLSLLSLLLSRVRLPGNRFLNLWSERGYTIYLYQSLVFVVVVLIRLHSYGKIPSSRVWLACDTITAILLSTLLCLVTYPVERWVVSRFGGRH